jgi:hypothetical protein
MTSKNSTIGFLIVLVGCLSFSIQGCGVYSFTGAAVDSRLQTFSVTQFQNQASLVVPTLAQSFSERLRDKMLQQTSLKSVQRDGDAQFSGAITQYSIAPQAVSAGSQTALNRLTLTVVIQYSNKADPTKNYEQTFSQFEDFSGNLAQVEAELIRNISDRIVDLVFNRTFSDW